MDVVVESDAMGMETIYPDDDSPYLKEHPIRTLGDLKKYDIPDPYKDGRIPIYLELSKNLKENVGKDTLIGMYVDGPFTLASQFMNAQELALKTIDDPNFVGEVLNFAADVAITYGRALERAGVDMVMILDPFSNIVSPQTFSKLILPFIQKIVKSIDVITILHVCGNARHLIERMADSEADGLSLDAPCDLKDVASRVPDDIVLMGNISPVDVMLRGDEKKVKNKVKGLLESMKGVRNFILSTGCECPPETPHSNIRAFMDAGRRSE
jgi:uroporphyrinogen decarboxylase